MKDWYLRQTPRDRLIVIVVGALSALGIVYAFVWQPLSTQLDNNRAALVSKHKTLEFVRQGAAQIKASSGKSGVNIRDDGGKAPYLLIDSVIRKAGIEPPERVEPSGSNGARVQFSEVSFDKLILVLAELELYGMSVSTMNITRKNTGTVSVRFNMERS